MSATTHIVFNVPGISCAHCKMAIEEALSGLEGIVSASVEVETRTVDVRLDPDLASVQIVTAAIVGAGYAVAGEHAFGD